RYANPVLFARLRPGREAPRPTGECAVATPRYANPVLFARLRRGREASHPTESTRARWLRQPSVACPPSAGTRGFASDWRARVCGGYASRREPSVVLPTAGGRRVQRSRNGSCTEGGDAPA